MRLDAKARALNATFTALSCNKGALCMRAFWFDAKQPLSMQHSHLSFASETELCIDQPCIAKDASAISPSLRRAVSTHTAPSTHTYPWLSRWPSPSTSAMALTPFRYMLFVTLLLSSAGGCCPPRGAALAQAAALRHLREVLCAALWALQRFSLTSQPRPRALPCPDC